MNKSMEHDLTFAKYRPTGRMISIEEVKQKGLACDCICAHCNQPLVAKLKNDKRTKHFAHYGNNEEICNSNVAYMSAVHRLAEQIIEDRKCVMLPEYGPIPAKLIHFDKVEVESRFDISYIQTDVVGITADGTRYLIEIKNTSAISDKKQEYIDDNEKICLEIDVAKVELEELEDFLINKPNNRVWINNPLYFKQLQATYPQYVIREESVCKNDCFFNRVGCTYFICVIRNKGKNYRLCKKTDALSSDRTMRSSVSETIGMNALKEELLRRKEEVKYSSVPQSPQDRTKFVHCPEPGPRFFERYLLNLKPEEPFVREEKVTRYVEDFFYDKHEDKLYVMACSYTLDVSRRYSIYEVKYNEKKGVKHNYCVGGSKEEIYEKFKSIKEKKKVQGKIFTDPEELPF